MKHTEKQQTIVIYYSQITKRNERRKQLNRKKLPTYKLEDLVVGGQKK